MQDLGMVSHGRPCDARVGLVALENTVSKVELEMCVFAKDGDVLRAAIDPPMVLPELGALIHRMLPSWGLDHQQQVLGCFLRCLSRYWQIKKFCLRSLLHALD
jgi:hypothetical protein